MKVITSTEGLRATEIIECKTDTGMPELLAEVTRVAEIRFVEGNDFAPVTVTLRLADTDYVTVKIT